MSELAAADWTPPAQAQRLPHAADAAGLRVRDAWRCLRTACAPFRDGARFQTLPDARFWQDGARLRAPGLRLPGRGDRSAQGYRLRLQSEASAPCSLRVDEPLLVDAPLWDAAHALLRSALGAQRAPTLPVQVALTLRSGGGDEAPWTCPAGCARLVGVLEGRVRTPHGEEGRAGDALWLPPDARLHDDGDSFALVLSIAVEPGTIRTATRAATEAVLLRLLDNMAADPGEVAMLEFPPASRVRGIAPHTTLRALAQTLGDASLHAALCDVVALEAALRASSHGLEPRPLNRPAALGDDTRLRLCPHGIVRRRLDQARWLVAVHGHALVAEDRAEWRRMWSQLCAGGVHPVATLVGKGRRAEGLREWLEALHAAGGVQADEAG